jgi:hypothetical protein
MRLSLQGLFIVLAEIIAFMYPTSNKLSKIITLLGSQWNLRTLPFYLINPSALKSPENPQVSKVGLTILAITLINHRKF